MNDISTGYDVSSPTTAGPPQQYAPPQYAPDTGAVDLSGVIDDTLELLRGRAEEVAAAEVKSTTVTNPTGTIRLICRANISSKELQRWNKRALPPVARKKGTANSFDVDNGVLYSSVLIDTTERVEVLGRNSEWRVVENRDTRDLLTFADDALLGVFGALDANVALMRIFGRDSDVVKAGMKVLTGAGWAEGATGLEDDDEGDPTA